MGLIEVALEYLARVTLERGVVVVEDVAEHAAGDFRALSPRENLEGVGVGLGEYVRFLYPAEPVDHRTVEVETLFKGVLEFGR